MTEKRLVWLFCSVFALAVLIEAKIVVLMCSGYDVLAEKQTVRTVDISTGRADIVDCNLEKITGTENQTKALITSKTNLQNIYESIRPQDRAKFYSRIQQQTDECENILLHIRDKALFGLLWTHYIYFVIFC